ncbi:MAG: tetratricopeptide repeat protein [Candidatus Zixiibacteriota bacterium]|nr:MAG: tetratricopeptide repeat protein [candidate division Zixibacteria bacterium]
MPGNVKITKRQIKEDKFTTMMLTTKDRVAENWQFVAIGLVVVIMIISGLVYYVNSQEEARQEAGERFARALLDYRNGEHQIAILGLNTIVEEYGSDDVAEQSVFLLGKLNLLDRNYPEASRYFEMYLDRYSQNLLNRAAAVAGLATCLENQGRYAEAAVKFETAASEFSGGPSEGDYLVGALRNYLEAGDPDRAKLVLERIEEDHSETEFLRRAQILFYEKGKSEPES